MIADRSGGRQGLGGGKHNQKYFIFETICFTRVAPHRVTDACRTDYVQVMQHVASAAQYSAVHCTPAHANPFRAFAPSRLRVIRAFAPSRLRVIRAFAPSRLRAFAPSRSRHPRHFAPSRSKPHFAPSRLRVRVIRAISRLRDPNPNPTPNPQPPNPPSDYVCAAGQKSALVMP